MRTVDLGGASACPWSLDIFPMTAERSNRIAQAFRPGLLSLTASRSLPDEVRPGEALAASHWEARARPLQAPPRQNRSPRRCDPTSKTGRLDDPSSEVSRRSRGERGSLWPKSEPARRSPATAGRSREMRPVRSRWRFKGSASTIRCRYRGRIFRQTCPHGPVGGC
jgi:hypothetical protein